MNEGKRETIDTRAKGLRALTFVGYAHRITPPLKYLYINKTKPFVSLRFWEW